MFFIYVKMLHFEVVLVRHRFHHRLRPCQSLLVHSPQSQSTPEFLNLLFLCQLSFVFKTLSLWLLFHKLKQTFHFFVFSILYFFFKLREFFQTLLLIDALPTSQVIFDLLHTPKTLNLVQSFIIVTIIVVTMEQKRPVDTINRQLHCSKLQVVIQQSYRCRFGISFHQLSLYYINALYINHFHDANSSLWVRKSASIYRALLFQRKLTLESQHLFLFCYLQYECVLHVRLQICEH